MPNASGNSRDLVALQHWFVNYYEVGLTTEITGSRYIADYKPDGFIGFTLRADGVEPSDEELSGWKFHISVAEQDRQKAFELILPILERHGIFHFKVANTEATKDFSRENDTQRGKIFTIYDYGEKGMVPALKEIEQALTAAPIGTNQPVTGDRWVHGSHYIYYRNEGGTNYVKSKLDPNNPTLYNPSNAQDPFDTFSVAPHTQTESILKDLLNTRLADNIVAVHWNETTNCYDLVVPDAFSRNIIKSNLVITEGLDRNGITMPDGNESPYLKTIPIPVQLLPENIRMIVDLSRSLEGHGTFSISETAQGDYRIDLGGDQKSQNVLLRRLSELGSQVTLVLPDASDTPRPPSVTVTSAEAMKVIEQARNLQ